MTPPKRRYKKKVAKEQKPMAEFKLTCLKCREVIDEWTDSKEPAIMIFDCLNCGSHWGVGSTMIHTGSTKPVDEEEPESTPKQTLRAKPKAKPKKHKK